MKNNVFENQGLFVVVRGRLCARLPIKQMGKRFLFSRTRNPQHLGGGFGKLRHMGFAALSARGRWLGARKLGDLS